ncbi:hypothetical protein [Streptomyces indicus]|uniref:Uncharacterized protein n=1 Tax=Streptomyces indicus TaxID=417292 RepID=A0A1G9BVV0_9ACTN|nr:hypothetical protein [Streptomyces indicus]SDK43601.1 hypothetical protein SAMN05421806_107273 [Streptomyces indicus]
MPDSPIATPDRHTASGTGTASAPVPAPAPAPACNENLLPAALSGLIEGSGNWRPGTLAGFTEAGAYLTGQRTEAPVRWQGWNWHRFIGGIGAVALRATAFHVPDDLRAVQLALLDVWSATPFADPEVRARMRTGTIELADKDTYAARDARGAVFAPHGLGSGEEGQRFIELRTAAPEPPAPGRVLSGEPVPAASWETPERLRRLVGLVREKGPAPWDRAAAARLAGATGLSRAGAALLLAGIPDVAYGHRSLSSEARKVMGLGQAEAAAGERELAALRVSARLALLADVLPEDPGQLWREGGQLALAERIADAWRAQQGVRPDVPEATLAVATEHTDVRMAPAALCAVLADPSREPRLTRTPDTRLRVNRISRGGWEGEEGFRFTELMTALCDAVDWIYAELPEGDPVRGGVPEAIRLLRERLADPHLLLSARGRSLRGREVATLLDTFPGAGPYLDAAEPLEHPTLDDGLVVVAEAGHDRRGDREAPSVFFRPGRYGADERSRRLESVIDTQPYPFPSHLARVRWLRGPECERIVRRIADRTLPPGGYESDPRLSAPDVVEEAAATTGLPEDAATLYLQLLALPVPTDRRIRRFNRWTPAHHKAVTSALVEAGLVTPDRRARAGRGVFLPGGWARGDKFHPPMETWKARLLGVRVIGDKTYSVPVAGPLPELFARAWRDRPRET